MTSRVARRMVLGLLSRARDGCIDVVEADGSRMRFGDPARSPHVTVWVHSGSVWRQFLRGSTGLAETYSRGLWDTDDLVGLIRIAARNVTTFDDWRRRFHAVLAPAQRLARMVPRNDPTGSRRNVAAHYDLGNDLFSLFLDRTMMYSCAVFDDPAATLEQAQAAKLERICRRLRLRADDHLLEIGTGWGEMAVHAAARYGCRVTSTTISREQHEMAQQRVRDAGLADRVTVLLEDYRDLRGSYDKLVSIEMIEAVGWQYFDAYFAACSRLLRPDGLMLLQAITIDERAYEVEKASRSFINTHIFPGGCLPSLKVIHRCVSEVTDMRTVWLDDITAHYSETLLRWREAFLVSVEDAEALGYDRRFRRMWELYLCYVEAGFRERRIGDVQLLLAKPGWREELRVLRPAPVRADDSVLSPEAA